MLLVRWLVIAIVFLASSYFLPGIHVKSFWTALIAAIVLSIINFFVKPVVIILTLPINFLTLGLFTFLINALMIWLVSAIVSGFVIDGFMWAFILALIVTVVKIFIF
ncbi:MAG: hypothetical protein UV48_C0027G0008 [Candidatus Azambacteria bacterium GW2011_GWA2_42_9]|uniref:Phage holin family protein n=1 Tax=Candidatus Azambacteria bacterium GW2011_GWA2_42_9 TaxID=1618613 RepID=A0A0G1DVI0_9BACT|nr:MAG: hypothetical protein UV48_C0027G0008 [Candidatus Azambacteria bacterium GW2011_GWA2_42_9]